MPLRRSVQRQRPERRLPSKDTRLHGCVRALDLGHVYEARAAAQQRTPREAELWDGLEAALIECARAVLQARTALDVGADERVQLPALELLWGKGDAGRGTRGGGMREGWGKEQAASEVGEVGALRLCCYGEKPKGEVMACCCKLPANLFYYTGQHVTAKRSASLPGQAVKLQHSAPGNQRMHQQGCCRTC